MDYAELFDLCDKLNDLLDDHGCDLEDKLSCLGSVVAGLVNGEIDDPIQRSIHLNVLFNGIRGRCGGGPVPH